MKRVAAITSVLTVTGAFAAGLFTTGGCEPRHKGATAPTGTGVAVAPSPTGTATGTAPTATATATTTATPTTTAPTTAPTPIPTPTIGTPPIGAWPTALPTIDPAMVAEISKKAAEMGIPLPGIPAPTAPTGDLLDTILKSSAAKYAPGYVPASPVGRAKLAQGEHAGMTVNMTNGKCYVVLGAAGAGVTTLTLNLMVPATPPNAVVATDAARGTAPVLGADKPLCPPVPAQVRVDTSPTVGGGDVAVQVWVK